MEDERTVLAARCSVKVDHDHEAVVLRPGDGVLHVLNLSLN
jgi:hypothetical protein